MNHLRKKARAVPLALVALLFLGGAAAFAQKHFKLIATGRPEVKVALAGTVERDGGLVPVEKAATVKSGEVLDWTITSENQGTGPAYRYKAVGQIPRGTQLVVGSVTADGSAAVAYSIDNGKSFSAQPTVEEKQADGSVRQVPAPASMYTQVRYEWSDPLSQGGKLNASYKVRVK
ncbi:MAG TPA: hypothetical protein VF507_08940 [Pyrinomonadaceae bacterium]